MKKETFCRYIRQYETDMFRFAKSIVGTQADGEDAMQESILKAYENYLESQDEEDTQKKEEFIPHEAGKVKMYTCGPTVYHYAHIGNLRSYIMEDVLEKYLRYLGYNVKRVMNITDVGHLTSDADEGED